MLRLLTLSVIAFVKLSVLAIILSISTPSAEAAPFGLPSKDECSAEGQEPCPALYTGEQCDDWLSEQNGTCQPCGSLGEPSCPRIKSGYPCSGSTEPDDNDICQPCGGSGERACRTFKPGDRCEGDLAIIDGFCEPCGGPGEYACPLLMSGYPCEGHYEPDDDDICQPCGGIGEQACRWGKSDSPCFKEGAVSRGGWGIGICIEDPNYARNPIRFYNASNERVWVAFYTWNHVNAGYENLGGINIDADSVSSVPLTGLACELEMRQQVQGAGDYETVSSSTILRSTMADEDYCEPKIFHAVIWDSEAHMIGDAIGAINMLNEEVPVSGSDSDLWHLAVHQNPYVSNSRIRGIALDLPQEESWVTYRGRNIHPDTAIVEAEGLTPADVGEELFTAPADRETRHYKLIDLTGRDSDGRPEGQTLNVPCGPGVCW